MIHIKGESMGSQDNMEERKVEEKALPDLYLSDFAEQMAQIMQEMGNHDRQVISITHLPQIAALGTTHYKVSKEETPTGTISRMVMLTPEQRIQEIAQMLSGSNISEAAIQNAKTLLGL